MWTKHISLFINEYYKVFSTLSGGLMRNAKTYTFSQYKWKRWFNIFLCSTGKISVS